MKKILTIALIAITTNCFSQGCPEFTPGSNISRVAPGLYKLSVNFDGNGQKHLNVTLFNGVPIVSNLISTVCIPIQGSGTINYNFVSTGSNPTAVVVPGTGNCGGGTCPQQAMTVTYSAAAPLPILIRSFFAQRKTDNVSLTWATLSEVNAKEFILQRNTGNGFEDIRVIPATNRANGASYTVTDINKSQNISLYRLKMVDFDGTFTTSDTRSVKAETSAAEYTVFPNPSNGNGKLSITDISGPTRVQLIDNTGRTIKIVLLDAGNSIELNNLQNGMYQLRIQNQSGKTITVRKLTIVN